MTSTRNLKLLSLLVALAPPTGVAADADAGQTKAEPCLACHFADDFIGESEQGILALIETTQEPGNAHPPRPAELDGDDMADIAAFFARGDVKPAASADVGRTKAEACLACHFADDFLGESAQDILALIEATQAPGTTHPERANELDEDDIADIAAFFALGE